MTHGLPRPFRGLALAVPLLVAAGLGASPALAHEPAAQRTEGQIASTPSELPAAAPAPVAVRLEDGNPARLRTEMLQKDRADLAALLEGRWDNDVQVFFEPEIGVPTGLRHTRIHLAVRALPDGVFPDPAFYAEYRQGGEGGSVVRQQVWTLVIDADADAIRLVPHAPSDPGAVAGAQSDPARLAVLVPGAVTAIEGCELVVRRRAGGFGAETRPGACRLGAPGDARSVIVSERHDISGGVWDVRDIGVDARGNRVFGVPDGSPARFRKARPFSCWMRTGNRTVTGLALHDQGGTAGASGPRGLRVRLRNVVWPVGANRPSLTLYLLEGTSEIASTFAWTDPDARRIALAQAGVEASCTEDAASLWQIGEEAPAPPPSSPPAVSP